LKLIQLFIFVTSVLPLFVKAEGELIKNLEIKFIRVVGDYSPNTTHDGTVELHFKSPITWGSTSTCIDPNRVIIDAKQTHLVSSAYMAYASNMKININVNTVLPVRSGICEIAYLDVIK